MFYKQVHTRSLVKEMLLEREVEFEHRMLDEEEKSLLSPGRSMSDAENEEQEQQQQQQEVDNVDVELARSVAAETGVHFEMPLKDPRSKFYVLAKKLVIASLFVGFLFASLALRYELESNPAFLSAHHNLTLFHNSSSTNSSTIG